MEIVITKTKKRNISFNKRKGMFYFWWYAQLKECGDNMSSRYMFYMIPKPIIMKKGSTLKDIAEKILKGFSKNVKETKIWGPSSKFPGQKIGLAHKLKDLDVVEFKTR